MGTPVSRRAVAGAGTGSTPCSVRTVPEPTLIGEQTTVSMSRRSRATAAPTISAMESAAPTSWKWTFSMGTWWTSASASASLRKTCMAVRLAGSARFARSIILTMPERWRWVVVSWAATRYLVAPMPLRTIFSKDTAAPTSSAAMAAVMAAASAPTSARAPTSMSPLTPENASKYQIIGTILPCTRWDRPSPFVVCQPSLKPGGLTDGERRSSVLQPLHGFEGLGDAAELVDRAIGQATQGGKLAIGKDADVDAPVPVAEQAVETVG